LEDRLLLICPPLALVLSIGGVVGGDRKWYTVVTLLVSGAITALILGSFLTH